jgi:hypothetical protein
MHDAHVRPTDFILSFSNFAITPITAFNLSSARVTSGSSRNFPSFIFCFKKFVGHAQVNFYSSGKRILWNQAVSNATVFFTYQNFVKL